MHRDDAGEPLPDTTPNTPSYVPSLDRFVPDFVDGDAAVIRDFARATSSWLSQEVGLDPAYLLSFSSLGVTPTRQAPPGWGTRAGRIPEYDVAPPLGQRALLALRDRKECLYWIQQIFDPGGTLVRVRAEPSDENLDLLDRQMGYVLFISHELSDDVVALERAARAAMR